MIGIVDYGLGNVRAFVNIYRRLGISAMPVQDALELESATRLILPGVGAFDWAMERLEASGMRAVLDKRVMRDGVPVLGVCVGMQIMARRSEEGRLPGLAWIEADVKRFEESCFHVRAQLPHMGWNDAVPVDDDPLFRSIEQPQFYFLHSYYLVPDRCDEVLARTCYGLIFASAVRKGNVYATQFHPEKSHDWGVQLLRNFAEL